MNRIIFSAILISICTAVDLQKINKCASKTSCSSCIQTSDCAWCSQPDFGDRPICYQPDLRDQTCDEAFVVNPDSEKKIILEDDWQIPQHIKLKSRISKKRFKFKTLLNN